MFLRKSTHFFSLLLVFPLNFIQLIYCDIGPSPSLFFCLSLIYYFCYYFCWWLQLHHLQILSFIYLKHLPTFIIKKTTTKNLFSTIVKIFQYDGAHELINGTFVYFLTSSMFSWTKCPTHWVSCIFLSSYSLGFHF